MRNGFATVARRFGRGGRLNAIAARRAETLPRNGSREAGTTSGDRPATSQPRALADGPTMVWSERGTQPWPTPGALQGDDVQLEFACFDRGREFGDAASGPNGWLGWRLG
jgi:hypothetical protein